MSKLHPEEQWRDILNRLVEATPKDNRTETGTTALFAEHMRFDLAGGVIPLYTLKETNFDAIVEEWLWFLSGSTNISDLKAKIWDQWAIDEDHTVVRPIPAKQRVAMLAEKLEMTMVQAEQEVGRYNARGPGHLENFYRKHEIPSQVEEVVYPKGDCGPIYGRMWTAWPCSNGQKINQVQYVEDTLRNNPNSRRILFHGWNPEFLPNEKLTPQENVKAGRQTLPPCHLDYIFDVIGGKLNLHLTLRSNDMFVGNPFNVAQAALWVHAFCNMFDDLEPGELSVLAVDCHLYDNHVESVKKLKRRKPREFPTLKINRKVDSIFDYRREDFEVVGYKPHPKIKVPVAK